MADPAAVPDALRLDGVAKSFGPVAALRDAWLRVAAGEFVTLLGPSGCGKTTLLNLVAGFLQADAGEILLAGEPVTGLPVWERNIGMVFQSYALFPHMSVAENIGYGLRARRLPRAEQQARVAEALRLVQLQHLADRRPRQLSGGQQQRAALARALVIRPRILLLDEPFSALDRGLRASMQLEVREIQRQAGLATLFVTHDQGEALSMSDRIAVMSAGAIQQIGTPQEIYDRPATRFVAGFVGESSILRAELLGREGEDAILRLGEARLRAPAAPLEGLAPGSAVDAFLRPDALRPARPGEAPGEAPVLAGSLRTAIFQGTHIDVQLDCAAARGGRVLFRLPPEALPGLAPGQALALAGPARCSAFPPEPEAP